MKDLLWNDNVEKQTNHRDTMCMWKLLCDRYDIKIGEERWTVSVNDTGTISMWKQVKLHIYHTQRLKLFKMD